MMYDTLYYNAITTYTHEQSYDVQVCVQVYTICCVASIVVPYKCVQVVGESLLITLPDHVAKKYSHI
jgi:hypothetical protein